MYCAKCGTEISEGTRFCHKCGTIKGDSSGNIMYCMNCGTKLSDDTEFCHMCGTKIIRSKDEKEAKSERVITASPSEISEANDIVTGQTVQKEDVLSDDNSNETKKDKESSETYVVIGAAIVGAIIIGMLFFREVIYGIVGILVIIGFVGYLAYALISGTDDERRNAKKLIIHGVLWIVVVGGIALYISQKPDALDDIMNIVSNITRPGVAVRDAYLTQYSDKVTIDRAFSKYFSNGKWDTYDKDGYSYVTFKGSCTILKEKADVCITFKITGENFIVESLDVNGKRQEDYMLVLLLQSVYENFDSEKQDSKNANLKTKTDFEEEADDYYDDNYYESDYGEETDYYYDENYINDEFSWVEQPDGKQNSGWVTITGIVRNTSGKDLSSVSIYFDLYDSSGNQIGSATDYISNLSANSTWRFEATGYEEKVARFEFRSISSW